MTDQLKARLDAFVAHCNKVVADYFAANGYTHAPPRREAEVISDKWAKVVVTEERGGQWVRTSVFCFVAIADNNTKTLGAVTAGDIHMAASFKAPAKHKRGSVLAEDFGNCVGPHGVAYLR